MNLPEPGDYIDCHVHGGRPAKDKFIVESLMAHEDKKPENLPGVCYTFGIHPWFLDETNQNKQLKAVKAAFDGPGIIAVGEAGFDKLRGPSPELQLKVFEEQVLISESHSKPLIIHCVRAWDELLSARKKLKPGMPWMIHGFRGSVELAAQLVSKGMYLSFWFDYIMRPESSGLVRTVPGDRIFLETDGADIDIRDIYMKVATDLNISVDVLKSDIYRNFNVFFRSQPVALLH